MSTCTLTADDYRLFGGRLGDGIMQTHVDIALATSWSEVERYLQAGITPTTGSYKTLWPVDNIVPLDHFYLRGIIQVVAWHDNGTCDGTEESFVETGVVMDARQAIISVRSCHGGWSFSNANAASLNPQPFLCQVDYTHGIWDDKTQIPPDVLGAIILLARWEAKQLSGQEELGAPEVQSFSNLGYSETRVPPKQTYFGTSYAAQRAERVLRHYRVKRMIRNRPSMSGSLIPGASSSQSGQPSSWRM